MHWFRLARRAAAALAVPALAAALVGCASRSPSTAAPGVQAAVTGFRTDDQRILACLDLQDHLIDLYAGEYVAQEGITLSPAEQAAFRNGWAEQLAKRGTFERFEQVCFYGVTRRRYECGMQGQTPGVVVDCMKMSAR